MSGFRPDWPCPPRVQSFITTRQGGYSRGPYASNNLGDHVGDDPEAVERNREQLAAALGIEAIGWLDQVHGSEIVRAGHHGHKPQADAVISRDAGRVCAVLTADCLPVLLCDEQGQQVAAVHCGWRGLAARLLDRVLANFEAPASQMLAWLGPAISVAHYEVGAEVLGALAQTVPERELFSRPSHRPGHFLVDLYAHARAQLQAAGVEQIYGGDRCSFAEAEHFFSYRRDGASGRMASLIWIDPAQG